MNLRESATIELVISMKIALVAIDTKYIHTNMAVRYLQANCRAESTVFEFTIKDSPERIRDVLAEYSPDVIGFSCYLWNILLVKKVLPLVKAAFHPFVVLGGPEVSFEPEPFLADPAVDCVIPGEGETAFDALISALEGKIPWESVPNLLRKGPEGLIHHPSAFPRTPDELEDPYPRLAAEGRDLSHKIQYVELSRGCPFHCSYCLASLDNRIRFFSAERVKRDILLLMNAGARTFKFLDRTFNLKPEAAMDVFQFLMESHHPGTVFQFEITGDILPQEIIQYINAHAPKGLFRFEIGIQSTNPEANRAVNRRQDDRQLFENIRLIREGGVVDLHLDLIAGLPLEDRASFENTFNQVFALRAKELQLGFLKLLRGTPLRRQADSLGYVYQEDPPYEIIKTAWLSEQDLKDIHLAEEALDLYWNKHCFPKAMDLLLEASPSPFRLFWDIGKFFVAAGYPFHQYSHPELFRRLAEFAERERSEKGDEIRDSLKWEYLSSFRLKPRIWWKERPDRITRNSILRNFRLAHPEMDAGEIDRAVVTTCQGRFLVAVYGASGPFLFLI